MGGRKRTIFENREDAVEDSEAEELLRFQTDTP